MPRLFLPTRIRIYRSINFWLGDGIAVQWPWRRTALKVLPFFVWDRNISGIELNAFFTLQPSGTEESEFFSRKSNLNPNTNASKPTICRCHSNKFIQWLETNEILLRGCQSCSLLLIEPLGQLSRRSLPHVQFPQKFVKIVSITSVPNRQVVVVQCLLEQARPFLRQR